MVRLLPQLFPSYSAVFVVLTFLLRCYVPYIYSPYYKVIYIADFVKCKGLRHKIEDVRRLPTKNPSVYSPDLFVRMFSGVLPAGEAGFRTSACAEVHLCRRLSVCTCIANQTLGRLKYWIGASETPVSQATS